MRKNYHNKYIILKMFFVLFIIAIPFVALTFLFTVVLSNCKINSASMEPTLRTGNTVFFNNLAYVKNDIERGDVVLFWSDEFDEYMSKRVIGLPGDEVSFRDGYVMINGHYCDESIYIKENIYTNSFDIFTVPNECYFLLGDNREYSYDSRYWMNPYISKDKIIGRYLIQIDFHLLKRGK